MREVADAAVKNRSSEILLDCTQLSRSRLGPTVCSGSNLGVAPIISLVRYFDHDAPDIERASEPLKRFFVRLELTEIIGPELFVRECLSPFFN